MSPGRLCKVSFIDKNEDLAFFVIACHHCLWLIVVDYVLSCLIYRRWHRLMGLIVFDGIDRV